MKISEYFTLSEMVKTSQKASNEPTETIVSNLTYLAKKLDQARVKLGEPIIINSGYRSPEVNKLVGGSANSQHMKGQAADMVCSDNAKLFGILKDMDFDELIWEFGTFPGQPDWVHCSFVKGRSRKKMMRAFKKNGETKYEIIPQ
jgi:hypothetical protein